jgi:hypothetical protein
MATTSLPFYQTINNFRFPPKIEKKNIEFVLNYSPQNSDKFLVTYPTCGTTWVQQIICLIKNNGILQKNNEHFMFKSFIDLRGKEFVNYRVIKTHLPFELMLYNKFTKYLCVIRNPKDTCVSFFYHIKADSCFEFSGDFHEFFDYWIKGEIAYGDYFQHILSF